MRSRRAGLTLLEVVVALAVLAIALLAWVRVQASVARVQRVDSVRRELAGWLGDELRLRRNVRTVGCRARAVRPGWTCSEIRACLDAGGRCELERVRVTVTGPVGPPLSGTTVVWWPLQAAPVRVRP